MKRRLLALLLTAASVLALAGCTDPAAAGKTTVKLWVYGDTTTIAAYNAMGDAFNATAGEEEGIYVRVIPKPESNYETLIANSVTSSRGPDVFAVSDRYFKTYADYYEPLDGYIGEGVTDDLYASTVERYRYNRENNTSDENSVQYALPVDHNPTTLYYNEDALRAAGIVVISVDEEDLDAFNAGAQADRTGKTKADYGLTDTIPAKGFYRSMYPFVKNERISNGSNWHAPVTGEVLVFNNRIPMSWDEIEDIGMIMTRSRSNIPSVTTDYGFYTEWWFNYGWSVGGNCLADMTGNGDWTFTLGDDTPNYIVAEGQTYTGIYTGTVYSEGETIGFTDRLDIDEGDEVIAENDGTYTVGGVKIGIRGDVSEKCEAGVLTELPSTKEAFTRFAMLAGEGGLNICPYPSAFASSQSSSNYFYSGKVAFLVERAVYLKQIDSSARFDWNVAPLPVYKEYTDPADPSCDEVLRKGIQSGHSDGIALAIRIGSEVKEESYKVIEWFCTAEGQKVWAENGFVPNCISLGKEYAESGEALADNIGVMVDSLEYEQPGDWWYMKDRAWIEIWSKPLNNEVRYGRMTLDEFFSTYISETNTLLKGY